MRKSFSLLLAIGFIATLCSCSSNPSSVSSDMESSAPVSSSVESSVESSLEEESSSSTTEERIVEDNDDQGVGRVKIETLKVRDSHRPDRSTFTPSGKVIFSYTINQGISIMRCEAEQKARVTNIFSGSIGSSKYRLMVFKDNKKILTGNGIIEAPEGTTLDDCSEKSCTFVPLEYPSEYVDDPAIITPWSEIIIADDGIHMAWTILTQHGVTNVMGELVRGESSYTLTDCHIISSSTSFTQTEEEGYYSYHPVIGGEVKQFVHGGKAISLVGSGSNGNGDSVVQDLATGEVTQITHNPGYDETTIFSPDEKFGVTMTSRFSDTSNLAILGFVPRPYGYAVQGIMYETYYYSVQGVRSYRPGNIGPALINIEKSMSDPDYMGIPLYDTTGEWVYLSPMSWNDDSTRCMWMEKSKDGNGVRMQIATLLDQQGGSALNTVTSPDPTGYEDTEFTSQSGNFKVKGKDSGYVEISLASGENRVHYYDYSDDGTTYYSGEESYHQSDKNYYYNSNVILKDTSGSEVGNMDVYLHFDTSRGTSVVLLDKENSYGTATYQGKTIDISALSQ